MRFQPPLCTTARCTAACPVPVAAHRPREGLSQPHQHASDGAGNGNGNGDGDGDGNGNGNGNGNGDGNQREERRTSINMDMHMEMHEIIDNTNWQHGQSYKNILQLRARPSHIYIHNH